MPVDHGTLGDVFAVGGAEEPERMPVSHCGDYVLLVGFQGYFHCFS